MPDDPGRTEWPPARGSPRSRVKTGSLENSAAGTLAARILSRMPDAEAVIMAKYHADRQRS